MVNVNDHVKDAEISRFPLDVYIHSLTRKKMPFCEASNRILIRTRPFNTCHPRKDFCTISSAANFAVSTQKKKYHICSQEAYQIWQTSIGNDEKKKASKSQAGWLDSPLWSVCTPVGCFNCIIHTLWLEGRQQNFPKSWGAFALTHTHKTQIDEQTKRERRIQMQKDCLVFFWQVVKKEDLHWGEFLHHT